MKLTALLLCGALGLSATTVAAAETGAPADATLIGASVLSDCPSYGCGYVDWSDPAAVTAYLQQAVADRTADAAARGMKDMVERGAKTSGKTNKGQGNALGQQDNSPQVVYLDFNPGSPTYFVDVRDAFTREFLGQFGPFDDYIYSQEDRDFVQSRLEADYGQYNYEFTQVLPPLDSDFTVLTFGDNDRPPGDTNITLFSFGGGSFSFSILFGAATNIDFRNDDRNDSAFIDASVWPFLRDLFGQGTLERLSGISGDVTEVVETAVLNQTSNTGAHELGHIQGLRHHDAWGAPGTGLPPGFNPLLFDPIGETDTDAVETFQHLMASGASAGLPLQGSTITDRFLSERSAVKMALNARTRDIAEAAVEGRKLKLRKLVSPNPLITGVNADGGLDVRAALVTGSIDTAEVEKDRYLISGQQGKVFNAEIISFSDRTGFAEPIIGQLELKFVEADGSETTVARNQLTFEGIDPLIFDFELPATGTYVLEVSTTDIIEFSTGGSISLTAIGLGEFLDGEYDLHVYIAEGKMGGGPGSLPGPSK